MADATFKMLNSVAASTVATDDSAAVPNGKNVYFEKLIMAELDLGDNLSSGILMQWGPVGSFEDIAAGAVTGSTVTIDIREERTGDGSKFVRLIRQNNSPLGAKRIMAWVKGYLR